MLLSNKRYYSGPGLLGDGEIHGEKEVMYNSNDKQMGG